MRNVCLFVGAVWILTGCLTPPAAAVMQFYKVFVAQYVDTHPDPEFQQYVTKDVKCFVCHQGKKRTNRNPFGQELAKLLDRKKDAKNTEKIIASLGAVVQLPSDPNDPRSQTFGQRIAAGKLPAGELEDLKKEPAADASQVSAAR